MQCVNGPASQTSWTGQLYRPAWQTSLTDQLNRPAERTRWTDHLDRPAGWTSWTDQLDVPVFFIWSLGQFASSKIFLSVCALSHLLSLTKAFFWKRGSNKAKQSQMGSNRAKQCKTGPNTAKLEQLGLNRAKLDQMGPAKANQSEPESFGSCKAFHMNLHLMDKTLKLNRALYSKTGKWAPNKNWWWGFQVFPWISIKFYSQFRSSRVGLS